MKAVHKFAIAIAAANNVFAEMSTPKYDGAKVWLKNHYLSLNNSLIFCIQMLAASPTVR